MILDQIVHHHRFAWRLQDLFRQSGNGKYFCLLFDQCTRCKSDHLLQWTCRHFLSFKINAKFAPEARCKLKKYNHDLADCFACAVLFLIHCQVMSSRSIAVAMTNLADSELT